MPERPPIAPEMKVSELLEAYPELEGPLVEIAPAFEKLNNPVLRRTIAKITTIRQAARVGDVPLGELINRLRRETGDAEEWSEGMSASDSRPADLPVGFSEESIVETFDAIELINSGGHPVGQVMASLKNLPAGKHYALVVPFEPAPLIDKAREAGFQAHVERQGDERFRVIFWQ